MSQKGSEGLARDPISGIERGTRGILSSPNTHGSKRPVTWMALTATPQSGCIGSSGFLLSDKCGVHMGLTPQNQD